MTSLSYQEICEALELDKKAGVDKSHSSGYLQRHQVKQVLPALIKKSVTPSLTKREQRIKLIELLEWFCAKQNWEVKKNQPIQYWKDKQKHDGKIEILVFEQKQPILAIEVKWKSDPVTTHKLASMYYQGFKPVLVILDTLDSQKITAIINELGLAKKAPHWLSVVGTPSE